MHSLRNGRQVKLFQRIYNKGNMKNIKADMI
jgi:hypothetical protein